MDDIDALLAEAGAQLTSIRAGYEESVQHREPATLLPRIKNLLENERSALDYLAMRIFDAYGSGKPTAKVYYPVAQSASAFPEWFKRNLPGVYQSRPDIWRAIRDRQKWRAGYAWLGQLHDLTIENKHQRLTRQVRHSALALEVDSNDPTEHRLRPGEVAPVSVDPTTPRATPVVKVGVDAQVGQTLQAVEYVDWFFETPHISVLQTLDEIHLGVGPLIADVRQVAGL